MAKTLVVVESPNKAKKIQQLLGAGYTVKASIGHICDLPQKEYGVDLTTFEETYELRNPKVVSDLRQLLKTHDEVLLATDPDREGEAIAWHIARELKLNVRTAKRITYGEITEAAIRASVAAPRALALGLVDAARARRVLDRIIGFDVSREICWPAGAQSAGRVQTPALHLLCVRERQILNFTATKYWTVSVGYAEGFGAFIAEPVPAKDTERTPNGGSNGGGEGSPDETEATGETEADALAKGRRGPRKFSSKAEAEALIATAKQHPHVVRDVQRRRAEKRPEAPYTTSTLQQDASRKLRLSAKQAADLAQSLFEAGYITYHRTDSTRVSDEAQQAAREHIRAVHPEALPAQPPRYKTKAGAQDAHEAIRPTHLEGDGAPPPGTAELYALVKARFLASQCKPAAFERTTVTVDSGPVEWLAEGSVLLDPGYLVFWAPYARQEDALLPAIAPQQRLTANEYAAEEKSTQPPGRYDTGSLIRKLEISGVGRPSTFAMIIETLLKRSYVQQITVGKGKSVLQPTELGLAVDALLTETFADLVSENYTADMEGQLDAIEHGAPTRHAYLNGWYAAFRSAMTDALPRAEAYRNAHGLHAKPRAGGGEETKTRCDRCGEANYRKIERKGGKGSFLACPACNMTRNVQAKTKPNGCPKCGSTLIERQGKDKSKFFGCVRYGASERPCDYIESTDGKARGRYLREETEKKCPKCGKHTLAILTPRDPAMGAAFYACNDPDRACGFTLPVGARRRKAPCPSCQGVVVERFRKQSPEEKAAGKPVKSFWSCARYPDCKYAEDIDLPPAATPAPASAGAA